MFTFIKGFGVGGGLIVAIGAQNAFVLSQGVKRNHIIVIPLICALCDAVLISAGVTGMGSAVAGNPIFSTIAAWGGAAFLFWYGLGSFKSALKGGQIETCDTGEKSLKSVILATLAVTLLNPHVYLDTVVLMGSISGQFKGNGRFIFGAGAATASFIWFFSLSLGGRILAPAFKNPLSWRILDSLVCCTMWIIGASLIITR